MQNMVRDPLVERLLGPGKAFELTEADVFGVRRQVFKGSPRNLAGIFRRAMTFGSNPMVVHDDIRLTYDEVFSRAASLAQALRDQFGVVRGTYVAMVMGNRSEWVISLIAITAAGGVAVLVNSRGVGEELLRATAATGCTLAIIDAERAAIVAAHQQNAPWPRILIGATDTMRPGVDANFAELSRPWSGQTFSPLETDPADGALVLFTSGTTGFPKGALISHGALAHAVALAGFMGALQDLRYEDEIGVTLPPERRSMTSPTVILGPMFHLGGMLPTVRALNFGGCVFIMSKWNVDIAFDMIEREGLARLAFVPTMLWDMLRSPRAGPSNLGSILYLSSGSSLLNPSLVAEIRQKMPNCMLANTYGQSETTAWGCSISGKAYFDHPESCGWPPPTVSVRVLRDDGTQAAVGEPGELWIGGANLMTEYVGDPAATAATLKDGWCASGDIGKVDENGLFYVVDRKKSMVISGGENIYCAEVERVLFDHPAVLEAIAYGVPDARLGEKLVATVVLHSGASATEEEIKLYCRQRLAIYKAPRAVRFSALPLPRTATGKYDRGTFLRSVADER